MRLAYTNTHSIGGVWGADPGGDQDLPVVRVADFDYAALRVNRLIPTARSIPASERAARLLEAGDILLEKSGGGLTTNVGRAVLYTSPEPAVCSNFIQLLRPAPGYDPRFLVYLHRVLYVRGVAAACTKQNTGIQNLSVNDYLATAVDVPTIATQRTAAEFVDRESARITDLGARLRSLDAAGLAIALGRFADAVSQLSVARVSYYFDVALGKMLDEKRIDLDNRSHYLRNTNVQWDRIDLTDLKTMTFLAREEERYGVRSGDLLVCEGGDPGRCAVWDGPDGMFIQKALLRARPHGDASVRYLAWMLRLCHSRGDFKADATGAAIRHLPAERLRALQIPIPRPEIQAELAREADERLHSSLALEEAASSMQRRLAEYRDALITEAVTGRLDLTSVSDAQMDERLYQAVETATA